MIARERLGAEVAVGKDIGNTMPQLRRAAAATADGEPIVKSHVDQPQTPSAKDDLKALPMPEVEKELGSSPDGLTQAEAQKRLTQYGPNEIKEEKTNPILKFLTYFWGPIPWMIEIAVILSAVVGHWEDFGIILFLLVCNAVVGFWEERQAGNAIDALKARLAINRADISSKSI